MANVGRTGGSKRGHGWRRVERRPQTKYAPRGGEVLHAKHSQAMPRERTPGRPSEPVSRQAPAQVCSHRQARMSKSCRIRCSPTLSSSRPWERQPAFPRNIPSASPHALRPPAFFPFAPDRLAPAPRPDTVGRHSGLQRCAKKLRLEALAPHEARLPSASRTRALNRCVPPGDFSDV